MEDNKNKISLATFIVSMIIMLVIVIGLLYYIIRIEEDKEIDENEEKEIINVEENREAEQKNDLEQDEIVNESKKTFEIYAEFTNYLITDSVKSLELLGLIDADSLRSKDHESVRIGTNDFINTGIKYSDFEKEIMKYVTKEYFEKEIKEYFIDVKGQLYIRSEGSSAGAINLEEFKLLNIADDTYVFDATIQRHTDDTGEISNSKYQVKMIKQGASYVVYETTYIDTEIISKGIGN